MQDRQPDRVFRIGKTTIRYYAPQITPEERQARLEEIHRVMWMIWERELSKNYSTDKEPR